MALSRPSASPSTEILRMNVTRSAAEVLAEHTTLALECIDRLYLERLRTAGAEPGRRVVLLPSGAGPSGAVGGVDGSDDAAFRQRLGVLRPMRVSGHPTITIGSTRNPHLPQRRRSGHKQFVSRRSAHHREPGPMGGGISHGRARAVVRTSSGTCGGRIVGLGAGATNRTGPQDGAAVSVAAEVASGIGARRRPTLGWPSTRNISTHGHRR